MNSTVFLLMLANVVFMYLVEARPQIAQDYEFSVEAGTGLKIIRDRFNDEEFQNRYFANPGEEEGLRYKRSIPESGEDLVILSDVDKQSEEVSAYPVLEDTVSNYFATLATFFARAITLEDGLVSPAVYNPF